MPVKTPVDSTTTSTPADDQSMADGSRSAKTARGSPLIDIDLPSTEGFTSPPKRPCTES
jgi:hypothetical protein